MIPIKYKNFALSAESFSNSRSWGHIGIFWIDGYAQYRVKITYYNRTWERYKYETVLYKLFSKVDKDSTMQLRDRIALYKLLKEYR